MFVMGELAAVSKDRHEINQGHSKTELSYRSKDRDVRVSCQRQVHQSFRRDISLLTTSGGWRWSIGCARCSPRDCANLQVRPSSAHEASAFMSLRRTKLVMSSACIESRLGLQKVSKCVIISKRVVKPVPQEEVSKSEKMERYLDILLRISRPDVVWRIMVLRADGKDCE